MTPVTGEQLDGRSQLGSDTIHLTEASEYGGRVCWPSVAEWRLRYCQTLRRASMLAECRGMEATLWSDVTDKKRKASHRQRKTQWLLGATPKIAKSACFLHHVCLPARNNSAPHYTNFHEIRHFAHFTKNLSRKFQVSLKSDKNNEHFTEDLCIFMIISRSIFLTARNISDRKLYRKSKHKFYAW